MVNLKLPDRRLRLAFFGTPDFASAVLSALIEHGKDEVALVVCQPDKPQGRGQKLEAPPTKKVAEAAGLEVLQPVKMKDGAVAQKLRELKIDLGIVVAFGRILPEDVLGAPAFGHWNVHASLLPRHRGASPIQHAILCGDRETGVTLMQMTLGLDEGPMLKKSKTPIDPEENAGTLFERLSKLGAETLLSGLEEAKSVGLSVEKQDDAQATFAPLLKKEDGRLDFSRPAFELVRRVRAMNPWPGCFTHLPDGTVLKIIKARAHDEAGPPGLEPGVISAIDEKTLKIQTLAGQLALLEVQPAGKRAMSIADFLRGAGRELKAGAVLGALAN